MIEVLKRKYWNKSESFLLPLTGLSKNLKYPMTSYLYWKDYSIDNYHLIVKFTYDNYIDFVNYCNKVIFPTVDRDGYLIETYDFDNESIFIMDISKWASDIEKFLAGKYSKLSKEAKDKITDFHIFFDKGPKIRIEISAILNPKETYSILDNMSAIEYVATNYKLNLPQLEKMGELGSILDKDKETLYENL